MLTVFLYSREDRIHLQRRDSLCSAGPGSRVGVFKAFTLPCEDENARLGCERSSGGMPALLPFMVLKVRLLILRAGAIDSTQCGPVTVRLSTYPFRQTSLGHHELLHPRAIDTTLVQARPVPSRHTCLPSPITLPGLLGDHIGSPVWFHIPAVGDVAGSPGYCPHGACVGHQVRQRCDPLL